VDAVSPEAGRAQLERRFGERYVDTSEGGSLRERVSAETEARMREMVEARPSGSRPGARRESARRSSRRWLTWRTRPSGWSGSRGG
jgi:hypothetical protein